MPNPPEYGVVGKPPREPTAESAASLASASENGTSGRLGEESKKKKRGPICRICKVVCSCACCCVYLWLLATVGPLGIAALGIFLRGDAEKPIVAKSLYSVIAHRGQPDNYPQHSEEGYTNLPPGVAWEADIQYADDLGRHFVAHDRVQLPTAKDLTLSAFMALSEVNDSTVMPEFKGGFNAQAWSSEDISRVAGLLCNRSEWMQTFHTETAGAITAACASARVLCLYPRLMYFPMAGVSIGQLDDGCDGEGRHWSDATWIALSRLISGEKRPLFIHGVNTRLHVRAVSAVMSHTVELEGVFSNNAPGLLGLGPSHERFGYAAGISAVWFSLFCWAVVACMLAPIFTSCQRECLNSQGIFLWALSGLNLLVFVAGCVVVGSDLDGVLTGFITSSIVAPAVFAVARLLSRVCGSKEADAEAPAQRQDTITI